MFKEWKNYFIENQKHLDHIDFNEKVELTKKEKEVIFSSIQQFQKGENSEGKHLHHFAKEWGNKDYFETIKLFIKEEQKHAIVLGRFMEINQIPKIKNHWVDRVFRGLRKMGGLENSINVLLTAEVIAAVYYQALREATSNQTLKQICDQILLDEEMHINFQSKTLGMLHLSKGIFARGFSVFKKRFLMMGTIAVVWIYHHKIYQAAGFSLASYIKETWAEYLRSEFMQRGKSAILIRNRSVISIG